MNDKTTEKKLTDKELLERAKAAEAKRVARAAEAAKRQAEQEEVRAKRKAAGMPLKTPEEKAADFKRLATKRMNNTLKGLKSIRNLANRGQYAFTDDQAAKIITTLHGYVEQIANAFEGTKATSEEFEV